MTATLPIDCGGSGVGKLVSAATVAKFGDELARRFELGLVAEQPGAVEMDIGEVQRQPSQAEVIAILPEHFAEAATKLKGRMSPELKAWTEAELVRLKRSH